MDLMQDNASTGTPEPGGLLWEDVIPIIKKFVRSLILLVLILMN